MNMKIMGNMKLTKTVRKRNSLNVLTVFWGRCPGRPLGNSLSFNSSIGIFLFFSIFFSHIVHVAFVIQTTVIAKVPKIQQIIVLLKTGMHTVHNGTIRTHVVTRITMVADAPN